MGVFSAFYDASVTGSITGITPSLYTLTYGTFPISDNEGSNEVSGNTNNFTGVIQVGWTGATGSPYLWLFVNDTWVDQLAWTGDGVYNFTSVSVSSVDDVTISAKGVPYYVYYSALLCGSPSTLKYFRDLYNNPTNTNIYGCCDVCGGPTGPCNPGSPQCFDNVSPSTVVNTNDVISWHEDCSCTNPPEPSQTPTETPSPTPTIPQCSCTYYDVFVSSTDLSDATGNSNPFQNNTLFLNYYDCNNVFVESSNSTPGFIANALCATSIAAPGSYYYYKNNNLTIASPNTYVTNNFTDCCPQTATPTPTPTDTPPVTPSRTPTQTPSYSQTATPTQTTTQTPTQTQTSTQTPTQTQTSTQTQTQTPSQTATQTPTVTPGLSPSQTSTQTPTPTKTPSQTPTNTQTPSQTPTQTPTNTQTPTTSPLVCGQGVTTGAYFYIDCCGDQQQGNSVGQVVSLNYTYPGTVGVTKLNVSASVTCLTQTPTQTQTQTPTPSITPSRTPTQTPTNAPSKTPSPTPTATPAFDLKNDCETFTLFDMGVQCVVVQSPSQGNNDGALSLIITGGTAPYRIFWDGVLGQQTKSNLPAGFYPVRVIDYYGDYTANTVCSLIAPSATPTSTPTSTPTPTVTPSYPKLCLVAIGQTSYGPLQFTSVGNRNGKPYWNSGTYYIVWKNTRWEIVGSDLTTPINFAGGAIFASSSPSAPPLTGWQAIGGTATYQLTMTQGNCASSLPLQVTVTKQNATCNTNTNCDGSITVNAQYGTTPYQYSINNGVTWQTSNIFQGLCPNTYTVLTRDASLISIPNTVVIAAELQPQTYQLQIGIIPKLSQTLSGPSGTQTIRYASISTVPALPVGTVIQATLNIRKEKVTNGPGSGTFTDNVLLTVNGGPITKTSDSFNTQTVTRPNCSPETQTTDTINEVYQFNFTVGDVVQLQTTSIIQMTNPQISPNGCSTELIETISGSLNQATIKGCTCCSVTTDQNIITINENIVAF